MYNVVKCNFFNNILFNNIESTGITLLLDHTFQYLPPSCKENRSHEGQCQEGTTKVYAIDRYIIQKP